MCSGEAFTWCIRQQGSQGLIQLQNTLNPSILSFSSGVFWLGNKCAGMCGNSPTAPCLGCAEQHRGAVGLEAGAGQPQAQDLETSFWVRGGATAEPELACAFQGVCFLRTCWAVITDELTGKKP